MWGNRCFSPSISNNVFEEWAPGLKLHFVHWRLLDVEISDRGSGGCTAFANNTNLDEAAKSKPPIFSQTIECSIFRRCCKTDIPDFWVKTLCFSVFLSPIVSAGKKVRLVSVGETEAANSFSWKTSSWLRSWFRKEKLMSSYSALRDWNTPRMVDENVWILLLTFVLPGESLEDGVNGGPIVKFWTYVCFCVVFIEWCLLLCLC